MKTRTHIETEYAPHGLTAQGMWRPLSVARYRSQETAERALEEHKKICENPRIAKFRGCKEYKVMKRTVVTTISEWEDV